MSWSNAIYQGEVPSDLTYLGIFLDRGVGSGSVLSFNSAHDLSPQATGVSDVFSFSNASEIDFSFQNGAYPTQAATQTVTSQAEVQVSAIDPTVLYRANHSTSVTFLPKQGSASPSATRPDFDFTRTVSISILNGVAVNLIFHSSGTGRASGSGHVITATWYQEDENGVSSSTTVAAPFRSFDAFGTFTVGSTGTLTRERLLVSGARIVGSNNATLGCRIGVFYVSPYLLESIPSNARLIITQSRSDILIADSAAAFTNEIWQPISATVAYSASCIDPTNALWTAEKSSTNAQLYMTRKGTAARETKAVITGVEPVAIAVGATIGKVLVLGSKSGSYKLFRSYEYGKTGTFTEVGVEAFPTSTHEKASGAYIGHNIFAAIAVEKTTKKLQIRHTKNDGVSWSTTVDIATLTTSEQYEIERMSSGHLRAFSKSFGKVYGSSNVLGASGSWSLIS